MRICLLTLTYPPASTEGIPRQRRTLGVELARMGHEVHVVTCGVRTHTWEDEGVAVHEIAVPATRRYSPRYPAIDQTLARSQALYEGLAALAARPPDVVDVPLWAAQGFVTHQRYAGATALWLQTTRAQIHAINGQRLSRDDRAHLDLERICLGRAHGLLSDSRAALGSVRRDYGVEPGGPTEIVYLGLPPLAGAMANRPAREWVEALVVGRLERRKGTPLLLELLPRLLHRHPRLRVRFVGGDNSANDGWQERYGKTYPDSFRARHPELVGRVSFEGYVDDGRLAACYRQADLLLAPSLYESFGLIFLEAMRAGLPVVTFGVGGAAEVFARGEVDGALLARPGDAAGLGEALGRLAEDEALRHRLGQAGLVRFEEAFTAEAMARGTLRFYEGLAERRRPAPGCPPAVYQVMEALDAGDAVSDIARSGARMLGAAGHPPVILTRRVPAGMEREAAPLERVLDTPDAALILHYWGLSTATWMLGAVRGRKALYYHNITPPHFFRRGTPIHQSLARGYAQLRRIADSFNLLLGDSRYNLSDLAPHLSRPLPAMHIYPVVEPAELQCAPYDQGLLERLRASGETNLLFVGRIAPNKRQDLLMRAFDRYVGECNPQARLWLVGSETFDPAYRRALEELRRSLASAERIVFTGKVPEAVMMAHFRGASALVCASEHEGFCVPVAQAMAFDLPVVAYAAAAVPETLGPSPGLLEVWDDVAAASAINRAVADAAVRGRMLEAQRIALRHFSVEEARARFVAAARFLQTGEESSLFERLPR